VTGLLEILLLGFWVYSIIDVLMSDPTGVRSLSKWVWLAIVVLIFPIFPIGGALWFALARPARSESGSRFPIGSPTPRRQRPRPVSVDPPVDEAVIRARIEERDRLLARWAEEDRRKGSEDETAAD
jgi:hypothetical protein